VNRGKVRPCEVRGQRLALVQQRAQVRRHFSSGLLGMLCSSRAARALGRRTRSEGRRVLDPRPARQQNAPFVFPSTTTSFRHMYNMYEASAQMSWLSDYWGYSPCRNRRRTTNLHHPKQRVMQVSFPVREMCGRKHSAAWFVGQNGEHEAVGVVLCCSAASAGTLAVKACLPQMQFMCS
jgi:hypothetical protein